MMLVMAAGWVGSHRDSGCSCIDSSCQSIQVHVIIVAMIVRKSVVMSLMKEMVSLFSICDGRGGDGGVEIVIVRARSEICCYTL